MSNTRPTATRKAPARGATTSPSPALRSEAEIDSASTQLSLAMALCGLANGEHLTCPWCGTAKAKKVKLVTDKRYIKCFKCGEYRGPIKLVQEMLGVSFPAAVDLLNGKAPGNPAEFDEVRAKRLAEAQARAEAMARNSFRADLSQETVNVYNAVLSSEFVSLAKAQEYYGTWHISPAAVATVGFVYIVDPDALARELVARFSKETVIASGIAKAIEEGEKDANGTGLRFMFSRNYPVVEPQIGPSGNCMSMQFRPSATQKAKITAHKNGRGEYVPPFMSLRGAGPDHLIGIGLDYLVKLSPTRVDIVEGAKDVAADLTLGNQAFGMPGTGVFPPKKTVQALAKAGHSIRVCMDGDEAGRAAQQKVLEHFLTQGFPPERISVHTMPVDLDVTDILVSRMAARGCTCATCVAWRESH